MRFFSLLVVLALSNFYFGQNMFEEQNRAIQSYFENSEELSEKAISDRFNELTRSEGFMVNDIVQSGSVYTKSLHRSGRVIFNSPATQYLNQIKSLLLKDYPNLDQLIHVYITEDPALNAFATVNNSIYVNVGLLARVQNEAQLAFILSHEIMHIVEAHLINNSLKISREAKVFTKSNVAINYEMLRLRHHEVSREFELQADLDGLTLYLKQNYDPSEALEAMKILKTADDYTVTISKSAKNLFIFDPVKFDTLKSEFKKLQAHMIDLEGKRKKPNLDTHPAIDERIDKISKLVDSLAKNPNANSKYLIAEKDFGLIKNQAIEMIQKMYTNEQDFISLFLFSSSELNERNNTSAENLNFLAYSIQGLLFEHNNRVKLGDARTTNSTDSLFSYYYKLTNKVDFAKWAYKSIDTLSKQYNDPKLNLYKIMIAKQIISDRTSDMKLIFGKDSTLIDFYKDTLKVSGLNLNKIDFEVTPRSDMTALQVSKYNKFERSGSISSGKVCLIGMNLIQIRKAQAFSYDYEIDLAKVERMERYADVACGNLVNDFDQKITSLIPNSIAYSGADYHAYDLLNNWLSERMLFSDVDYVSIYEDEIKQLRQNKNIHYVFSNVNVGVKSFSFKSFLLTYFSPFIMPFYIPQNIAHIIGSSTRKFQLSLVFDINNGDLVFWDKRTYLDPNSSSFLYNVNADVLNNFFHE